MLTIRVRRLDQGRATVATIAVPGERLGEHPIDGEWAELRFPLAAAPRSLEIRVPEEGAQLELDHVLFLPDG